MLMEFTARRFLRLHKWHGCFGSAYDASTRSDVGGLEKLLEVAKWSFTGLYFLLEMPTIVSTHISVWTLML